MSDRASHRAKVLRYGEQTERRDDQLAAEEPLELRLDGEPLTVMMRTPGHDRELALGFCYGEGIIRAVDDVTTFTVVPNGEHPELENVLDLQLASTAPGRDARWQRQFFAASSCGLCGVSSIEAIHSQAPPLPDDDLRIAPEVLFTLDERCTRQGSSPKPATHSWCERTSAATMRSTRSSGTRWKEAWFRCRVPS